MLVVQVKEIQPTVQAVEEEVLVQLVLRQQTKEMVVMVVLEHKAL
jgi:hypothetical protein